MSPEEIVAEGRREFLLKGSRIAFGWPVFSLAGCMRQQIGDNTRAENTGTENWDVLITDLEEQVPALLAQAPTVPAVSMALVADAKLLWQGAFGVKDFGSGEPVDAQTVFEAASVSKTVFAYAILKLCEKGVLDLDTPLTEYTPDRVVDGDSRLDLITTRHILSHTSGFQNWRSATEPLKIQFTPGERWEYSGEGYSYLHSVMTHLTGRVDPEDCRTLDDGLEVCATDFDAYMRANLFIPFAMRSSGYLYQEGMARPHDDQGSMLADRKSTAITAARFGSAGDLHTTPTDYARFLMEVIDPKPADEYRLGAASLEDMTTPQVPITESLSWGLGWAIEHKEDGSDVISNSGDNPGFKTLTAASAERKTGFMIMTNGDRGFDEIIRPLVRSQPMQEFLSVNV